MSRQRSRARAQAARTARTAPSPSPSASAASASAIDPAPDADQTADDLHARALELREYRMGRGRRPAGIDAPKSVVTNTGTFSATYPVMGMTCRTCEVRIARFVGKLPNVEHVTASAVRGQVTVETTAPVSSAAIEKAINKAGYEIGHTPWLASDPSIWATAGAGVLLVAAIAVVAQVTGIGDLAAGAGDLSKGGLVVALLLGLAAGVSTCMALVGGLVLGLSASYQASRPAAGEVGQGAAAQMRPAVVLVAGRVAGYAIFGAALGAVGANITMPPQLTAALMIAVAIVMTLLGARLTGLSPRVAGWSPTLPMGLGARLGLGERNVVAYSDRRAAMIGAATFFLPCGFTQAIQIYAISTGSPLFAAALLGTFAIGTAPGLLALAGLPAVVPSGAKPTLLRLVGVVVLGFALLNGSAGLRLSGFTMPSLVGFASAAPLPGTLAADGTQAITTYQDANGYSPANIVIYAGYPTRWTVQSSNTSTCAASLWAPAVDIRARLNKGANTFELPALNAGTLNYTCAMGMYSGKITVVDRPADAAGSSPAAPVASPVTAPAPTASPVTADASTAAPAVASPEPTAAGAAPRASSAPAASAGPAVQELRTVQDEDGYSPAVARITTGIPTRWHIDSRSQYSCAAYVVVPDLGIQLSLNPGDNVIDLPAMKPGVLQYTCGMGMFSGTILIDNGPAGASG
jgi:sulfite exporter TauE/SafE/plastocyanin domain-containing protein/copper chaperone CopZ